LPPVDVQPDGTGIGYGNKTLSCLNLSANKIDDVGVQAMADAFLQYMDEVGQTLDTVLLQRNPAISEEVAALFRGEAFENINVEF
jgi:hypothetical protein